MIDAMTRKARIQEQFGARIRQLRVARNWSQESFAERCGLDRTYISGIERGQRNVSLLNIERIAHHLGISLSELFRGIDDESQINP